MSDDDRPLSAIDRERLDAFKAAMTRCRWFLLTVLLTSCFMLLHLFTGERGYQTFQAQQLFHDRLVKAPREALAAALVADSIRGLSLSTDSSRIVALLKRHPGIKLQQDLRRHLTDPKDDRHAREVAQGVYKAIVWEREITDLRLREGTVPLLGIEVPSNDYVVVMTWLLLIFSTGLWLNLRSIEGVVRTIDWRSPLKRFIQLHVTFTGIMKESRGTRISHGLQYVALWLPCVLFVLTCAFDVVPSVQALLQNPGLVVLGEPLYILLRLALFGVASMWLVALAVSNSGRMMRLDRWLYAEDRRKEGPTVERT